MSKKPNSDVAHLCSLPAVRERCTAMLDLARAGKTVAMDVDESKLPNVVDFVVQLIQRDYKNPTDVPPHSRWRHFEMDGIDRIAELHKEWTVQGVENVEQARRVLDLFIVSVLLDAGAGNEWKFVESGSGKTYRRSEGLAIASLEMFKAGAFSSNPETATQVDAVGLSNLTVDTLRIGMQVSGSNPLVGLDGRCSLLVKLGQVLSGSMMFTGAKYARPGNLIDFLQTKVADNAIDIDDLWAVVQQLKPIWPSRLTLHGTPLGDVWRSRAMQAQATSDASALVPLHKLSQWLTYSLMEPLESILGWTVRRKAHLTGLAEYRNGGLFLDFGVLKPHDEVLDRGMRQAREQAGEGAEVVEMVPLFHPDDDAIVEWRALTVALLDEVGKGVRGVLGMSADTLELAKVLEGGTWKAGREIAAKKRPVTRGPPMNLISDGTVF
ncbi:hypothetical protein AMAG_03164 [Allomyces macrogynus ATCC 38327]|uniref:DUF1688 domain-containing protein n=1 Tax=Allomyces macrogynus (strain ATCC 38327) TaxID=578462 RepID=A0A0L0S4L7_ALLM3|nr:hypothetical protein AMAG_03164 [Allomyces macrogynus ATCC 38327]|eukprot:KNE57453.1 hypothetical protein AMAG_03164 [Allomyces macrogynus ATCC 38327]